MRFRKCIASKPGMFDNLSFEFSDDISIIYGKNGSGKTLLAKSFIDAIFKRTENASIISAELWDTLYLDLAVAFSDGNTYTFTNNGNKYYKINHVQDGHEHILLATGTNPPVDDFSKSCGETLKSFYAKINVQTFIDSSFIHSPSDIKKTAMLEYSSIKEIVLMDKTNFFNYSVAAEHMLQKHNKNNKILGEILRYESILKDLNKKITIIEIQNTRVEKLFHEKEKITLEIDAMQKSLESHLHKKEVLRTMLGDIDRLKELHADLHNIKEEVKQEQDRYHLIAHLETEIKNSFPQFKNLNIAEGLTLDELQDTFIEMRNINEKIDNYYFDKDLKRKKFTRIAIAVNISAIMAIFTILYKNKFSFSKDMYLSAGVLGFALVFTPILFLINSLTAQKKTLAQYVSEKERLEEKLKTVLQKSKISLEGYKLSELYEFLLQYFEDYIEYTEKLKEYSQLKDSLKDKKYLKNIEAKLQVLKNEEKKITEGINRCIASLEIEGEASSESNKVQNLLYNIDREIELLSSQIDKKNQILEQIEEEKNLAPNTGNGIGTLFEVKKNNESILQGLSICLNSFNYVNHLLIEAIKKRERRQFQKLVKLSMEKFNFITSNQYITKIDEASLHAIIETHNIPENLNPTVLHALLLSIKLSLADFLVEANITMPLIIDDPFQFMDEDRMQRFKEVLRDVSRMRQIIIFTHQKNTNLWENYIEL